MLENGLRLQVLEINHVRRSKALTAQVAAIPLSIVFETYCSSIVSPPSFRGHATMHNSDRFEQRYCGSINGSSCLPAAVHLGKTLMIEWSRCGGRG